MHYQIAIAGSKQETAKKILWGGTLEQDFTCIRIPCVDDATNFFATTKNGNGENEQGIVHRHGILCR